MTRLKAEWIKHMPSGMDEYNLWLKRRAGIDLSGLIMKAYGINEAELEAARRTYKVGVVPITQGEGIIGSFSDAVCAIVKSVGFEAAVSPGTDVDGIYRSMEAGAGILFMADDMRYLALNTLSGRTGENDCSTALGFIHILRSMAEMRGVDIERGKILVIGYGRVGRCAASILKESKLKFDFYDKDSCRRSEIREDFKGENVGIIESEADIKKYRLILDFTNEGGWLKREYLRNDAIYSSPGVPVSPDEDALLALQNNAVYDNLEIGTAMMLAEAIFGTKK